MRNIFLLLTILVSTAACNKKLKETIGMSTPGPNEYQVQRSKMLEVPPHYDLPTPTYQQMQDKVSINNQDSSQAEMNEGERALMREIN